VWTLLLAVLALSAGLASWRVRSMQGSVAPATALGAQVPEHRKPLRAVAERRESLASVRGRLAPGGARTPAGEVDEWTLRLATSPPYREEMLRALERMRHLEPVIRSALARESLPRDLLYLALVESSYRSAATSRAGAAGVWQFMPATARGYGLEVGPWVDERRDPVRASGAAARHLRDLHAKLGGWQLAVAAYNCGAGCVERAVRLHGGGGGGDLLYWRVRPHLPRETRDYVPRLLAAARIARDPAAFGFAIGGDAPLAYREVLVPGGTPLAPVARWAGVPEADVSALNPHLVRGQTPPGRRWPVRVPLLQRNPTMHGEATISEAPPADLPRGGQREREGTIQDRIIRPLLDAGELAPHDVDEAYQAAAADRERRSAVFHLVEMGRLTAGRALEVLGRFFGVETVSLAAERPERGVLGLIDGETARQLRVVPLRIEGRDLWVANGDPYDLSSLSRIRDITGLSPVPLLADDHSLDTLLRAVYAEADKLHRVMGEAQRSGARVRARASISEEIENAVRGAQVPRMVEAFIEDAVKKRASDVHFEFFDHLGRIRYRIDGQLVVARELDPTWGREIVNRIKVLSGLNSAQDRIPEDGRMKHRLEDGAEVELRVSTLPTDWGCEHAVLRVLARAQTPVDLPSVGMGRRDHAVFAEAVDRPQGMILVTGPTGSGKSTTLYAALDHLNDPARSIITIEDPVERKIRGIRQTSVGAGMTFATALRSILRQDPDVIMVGEIRDAETAGTAVKAAMTGHLLLSTLHTNDAPSTVARLLDIGIEPYNLVDALSLVVAQRLVRRICPRCREECVPSAHELSRAGLSRDEAAETPFRRGTGCSYCNRSGYFGRLGLFEMMPLSPALRDAIVARRPGAELRALAVDEGMTTLRQAGIERMRAGETTLEEVTRETMQG
jgi:type IV pilus assembly protein PilB